MENRSHALIAGLFTLLLGVAAVLSLWWFGGKSENTRDYLVYTAKSVTGLNPQAQVRYRGIRVGRVESIDLDPADTRNILIRIRIRDDIPVTEDTTAHLGYQGVTGIAHIQLDRPGQNGDGESADSPLLQAATAGDLPRIPMQDSFVQALTDTGTDTLRQIHDLVVNVNRLLNSENRQVLTRALNNFAAASDNAREASTQLRLALSPENLRALQATLQQAEYAAGQAGPFFAESRGLVARLQNVSGKLDAVLGDASGSAASATIPRLNELGGELTTTLRQLSRVLQMLEDRPQSLIFGHSKQTPGPGEDGFVAPVTVNKPASIPANMPVNHPVNKEQP